MARQQLILAGVFLSFLFCYLEWGNHHSSFIFQTEYSILTNTGSAADNFRHPLILLPFAGQLLLLIAIFQKQPKKILPIVSIALLAVLVSIILLAGLLSMNFRIVLSTVPFVLLSVLFFINRKSKTISAKGF